MKKIAIFDAMGVIFTTGDDVGELLIPYISGKLSEADHGLVRKLYLEASLGRITPRDFWKGVGFGEAVIAPFEAGYLNNNFCLDPGFFPCAEALKGKGYTLAMLSNDVGEWSRHLRQKHGLDRIIEYAFISSELGLRKPDPEIYRIALSKMGALPGECVFVDDSPERVDAARMLGIRGIYFDRDGEDYDGPMVKSFEQLAELLV